MVERLFRILIVAFVAALAATAYAFKVPFGRFLIFVAALGGLAGVVWLIGRRSDRRALEKQTAFLERGIRVRGTVINVTVTRARSVRWWEIGAEFEYNGNRYLAASNRLFTKPRFEVGDAINVYFMPGDPNDNTIMDGDTTRPYSL